MYVFANSCRMGKPTVDVFERQMAALGKGESAVAMASETAAVLMTVMALAKAGDNIVSSPKLYGGTNLPSSLRSLPSFGVHDPVSGSVWESFLRGLIDGNTKLVFCKSVSNLDFSVADYSELVAIAHAAGVPVAVSTRRIATQSS